MTVPTSPNYIPFLRDERGDGTFEFHSQVAERTESRVKKRKKKKQHNTAELLSGLLISRLHSLP